MSAHPDGVGLGHWLSQAAATPDALEDAGYVALLGADGEDLQTLTRLADDLRRRQVGDEITFAVNRNLETARVARAADRPRLEELLDEAWALGATEICLQGPLPEDAPADGYLELVEAILGQLPSVHLHAFRPAEVADGARVMGISERDFLIRARAAGLGSVPGTGARILDDRVRAALTDGSDLPAHRWIELISLAHEVGLPSTATMIYGHIETPAQQVAHLRTLAAIQGRTGGFSELILMPIQPEQVPPAISASVRYADARETRALHAVARLMLGGQIEHLQGAWPKYGLELTRELLNGGVDDLGGILLDGELAPAAGPEAGISLTIAEVDDLASGLGRGVRQRTTLYGDPGAERIAAARGLAFGPAE
jgi:FO synthase subunit 2